MDTIEPEQTEAEAADGVVWLEPEDGRAMFDALARKTLGISGDEFIRRYEAGEYRGLPCNDAANWPLIRLSMLIPCGRPTEGYGSLTLG